jgi:Kef-type K+ transport system membrane component KefB/nucleotide-binding universal stress UspA family protein
VLAAFAMMALTTAAAAVEGSGSTRGSEALLIGQVSLLIVAGWLLGEAMLRLGQPAVMGQLLAGILLGPSVLGVCWPDAQLFLFPHSIAQKSMLDGLAQFGILLLLLLAGMETELALVRHVRRAALSASMNGIVLPFICGFLLGQSLPEALLPVPERRLITSLFLGTALAISSVKIVASVIRDMGFLRRNVGQVILASAIVDDTIGWIIIAITLGLAGEESFSWLSVGKNVVGTLLFLALSFTIGRRLVFKTIQLTNDHFSGEAPVIAAILGLMGIFALVTQLIGVHTVLGAFVAGILVGESPMLTTEIDRQLRGLVAVLFMPVFFGLAGLSADLTVLKDPQLALLTLGIIAIASIGKAAGAFAGGWLGGLTAKESTALAMGMNARGSTEVVVASIGLSMGVLSQNLFTMIVAMAVITTIAMPPTLRWSLQRLPMRREEKQRLAREQYEKRAFVPTLERVLLTVDGSINGQFASQITGLLAGSRNMPVTVLNIDAAAAGAKPSMASDKKSPNPAVEAVQAVTAVADAAKPQDSTVPKIDVIKREHHASAAEAITAEAQRGYDLLVLGVEPTASSRGDFHENISQLVAAFDGSIAIVVARGEHERDPMCPVRKILVPITGNENSRRGAEVAMVAGKSAQAEVATISVISGEARNKRRGRRETEAVAHETKDIASHLQMRVATTVRFDVSAADAILQMIEKGKHDFVVMGVSRRPGDSLSFGEVAHSLLESANCSLMFIAPQARTGSARSSHKGG